jgi:nitroreductase
MSAAETLANIIHDRRTVKKFTGAPVSREKILSLLEATRWAPNHRLAEPWRFVVVSQDQYAKLAAFLNAEPDIAGYPNPEKGAAKLAKLLDRLPGAGAIIIATWVRADDPGIDVEDHSAAAAAVQNLLLSAEADGIASYWSTTAALMHAKTLQWCGIDPAQEACLGWIWLGTAAEHPPVPARSPLSERVRFLAR